MHRVVVVAVPPLNAFDLSIPGLIFGGVEVDGRPAYDVRVVSMAEPGIVRTETALDVYVRDGLEAVDETETVMVTWGAGRDESPDARWAEGLPVRRRLVRRWVAF